MKTKLEIDLDPQYLKETLSEVITELVKEELVSMLRIFAKKRVKEEIDKIIEPLAVHALTDGGFNVASEYGGERKVSIDQNVKRMITRYFDERVYTYSKGSDLISEHFSVTSDSSSRNPSRIEAYIKFVIEKYMDENIVPRIKEILTEMATEKLKLEEIVNSKLAILVNQKLK